MALPHADARSLTNFVAESHALVPGQKPRGASALGGAGKRPGRRLGPAAHGRASTNLDPPKTKLRRQEG
eukprot:4483582-Pyramimonas_sp.AAC.1